MLPFVLRLTEAPVASCGQLCLSVCEAWEHEPFLTAESPNVPGGVESVVGKEQKGG